MRLKQRVLAWANRVLKKRSYQIVRLPSYYYESETSKCRPRLLKYCVGYGIDVGFGGDPISEHTIRVDQQKPYAATSSYPVQLGGDAARLPWFADSSLDFVYSSHLLEDFENTERVLREWWRVLKPGGMMILFCPDEQIYRRHCALTGQTYNTYHKHSNFSLAFVKNILQKFADYEVVYECPLVNVYSWEFVCRKRPVAEIETESKALRLNSRVLTYG